MKLSPKFGESEMLMPPGIITAWMKWWPILGSAKIDRVASSWIGEIQAINEF